MVISNQLNTKSRGGMRKIKCKEKMKVGNNSGMGTECAINRKRYSGLGQCLCNKENCPKLSRRSINEDI